MRKFPTTETFEFASTRETRLLLVAANGGSVTIEVWDGDSWHVADVYSVDVAKEYYTQGGKMRFTPAGGATYSLDLTQGVVL